MSQQRHVSNKKASRKAELDKWKSKLMKSRMLKRVVKEYIYSVGRPWCFIKKVSSQPLQIWCHRNKVWQNPRLNIAPVIEDICCLAFRLTVAVSEGNSCSHITTSLVSVTHQICEQRFHTDIGQTSLCAAVFQESMIALFITCIWWLHWNQLRACFYQPGAGGSRDSFEQCVRSHSSWEVSFDGKWRFCCIANPGTGYAWQGSLVQAMRDDLFASV